MLKRGYDPLPYLRFRSVVIMAKHRSDGTNNYPPANVGGTDKSFTRVIKNLSLLLFRAQFHPSMNVHRENPDIHARTPRGSLSREVAFGCGHSEYESLLSALCSLILRLYKDIQVFPTRVQVWAAQVKAESMVTNETRG